MLWIFSKPPAFAPGWNHPGAKAEEYFSVVLGAGLQMTKH
jgi:hypothetical protein